MKNPLFSIIIANYNHGQFIESAIKSVLNQSCKNFELIIVDGGSSDDSLDIIKRYSDPISWWCSEKDQGQSDAFNKGFAHAKGRFGCWLNADDKMMPGALQAVEEIVIRRPDTKWIAGSTVFIDEHDNVIWCSQSMRRLTPPYKWFAIPTVNGPSSFFLIEKLRTLGGFDVSLHYSMDIDLWQRFYASGMKPNFIGHYLWAFRVHEDSKTSGRLLTGRSTQEHSSEGKLVLDRYDHRERRYRLGIKIVKALKLFSGTYIRSYYDTLRYKNKSISEIQEHQ